MSYQKSSDFKKILSPLWIFAFIFYVNAFAQMEESEDDSVFSDKVKAVRVAEGVWDVFLEQNKGPWELPPKTNEKSALLKTLKNAEKSKETLKFKVDPVKEIIIRAEVPVNKPKHETQDAAETDDDK